MAAQYINNSSIYTTRRLYISITRNRVFLFFKVLCCLLISINIVACSSRDKPAPVVTVYGSTPLKNNVRNSINTDEYTVRSGETLYSIAWRADSDVRQLARINNITAPYNIYKGQKLFLVSKNKGKSPKASSSKHSSKKQTKSSKSTGTKVLKNTIASSKKQAYGENITDKKKISNRTANIPNAPFSQKISQWRWPVKGKIIATFSSRVQGNKGIDIAGRRGTSIKSAASGKVVYAGSALRGYGKLIIIKHNDDYLSAYAHNDKILVKEQQHVKSGDVIAKMGSTAAQKVMLHFEVRFRGKSVDPLKYLPKKQ